jgi:hypothetical protein
VTRALLFVAVLLGLAGCKESEYDRLDIRPQIASPATLQGGWISRSEIKIPEGMLMKAHITVYDDDDKPMPLTIRSRNPRVLEVSTIVNPDDYAFIGKEVGSAAIELVANETLILTIEATVSRQLGAGAVAPTPAPGPGDATSPNSSAR